MMANAVPDHSSLPVMCALQNEDMFAQGLWALDRQSAPGDLIAVFKKHNFPVSRRSKDRGHRLVFYLATPN